MIRNKRRYMNRGPSGGMERRKNQVDLRTLADTPPWDWPRDAGTLFQEILTDHKAKESDRLIAAQLAGDFTVTRLFLAIRMFSRGDKSTRSA